MLRKAIFLFTVLVFLVSVTGCATHQRDLKMQGLRNQVSALEAQLQAKDKEIEALKDVLSTSEQKREAAQKKKVAGEAKSRPTIKQIQIALKNAGYNPGPVDGKEGKQTKDAIKAFQRANNLTVDGRVGKDTWRLLSKYLQ